MSSGKVLCKCESFLATLNVLTNKQIQALEAILLRCPVEVVSYLDAIIQAGNQYIKYDPVSSYSSDFNTPHLMPLSKELCW